MANQYYLGVFLQFKNAYMDYNILRKCFFVSLLGLFLATPLSTARAACTGNVCTDLTTTDGSLNSTGATVTNNIVTGSTYNGVISGTGFGGVSLSVTDTGANGNIFSLTGSNTYSGSTQILANATLSLTSETNIVNSSGISITSGTLQFAGNTTITQALTISGGSIINTGANADIYSGAISGSGNLTKNGSGSLILTNTDAYAGTTNIAAGTLQLDGTLASSAITVANGATLKGLGTATGSVINNGIVAPGDTTGTLAIIGNYSGTGALNTQLTGSNTAGNFDQLAVVGTANISSQTLNYFPLAPAPASKYVRGTTYQILTATTGVAGRFTNAPDGSIITSSSTGANAGNAATIAASSDPALALQTNYNSNGLEVDTTILRAEFFGAAPSATPNEASVGTALDSLQLSTTSGDMNTLLNALSAVPTAQQAAALNMLSGEVNAQIQSTFRESQRNFDGMLGKRLGGDCDDTTNGASSALAQHKVMGAPGSNAAAWGCVYGSTAHVSGDSNAGNSDTTFIGGAAGYEFKPDPLTVVRVGAGYNNAALTATSTASSADLDSYQTGIYAQYNFFDKAYVGGSLAGAYNTGDTTRDIAFSGFYRKASGNPDGYGLSSTALLGYAGEFDTVSIVPLASFEYIYNHQNSFTESGAGAADLYVHDKGTSALRSSLGAQMSKIYDIGDDLTFTPEGRAAFIYDAFALAPNINQTFAGTNAGFNVGGPNPGRAGFQGGLGGTLGMQNNLAVFVDYDGTFKANETDHRFLGGLKFTW